MTARLHYWYLTHPRWGRPALFVATMYALMVTAVVGAPAATAATNSAALNWTGLKDSYGVPIGDYFLAIASPLDQLTEAGPGVTWDPGTWLAWTMHAVNVFTTKAGIAGILTGEAGLFIGIVTLCWWIFKVTVSSYWLLVIGEIARAIASATMIVGVRLGLLALASFGIFWGVMTVYRGERGRGLTMILIAIVMPVLSFAVFYDPAGMMYGPNGLLAFGRSVGFSVAEAATHNRQVGVDFLTASMITKTVREPLQLWNFGQVVDNFGNCAGLYSGALRSGDPQGPIRAMKTCGNHDAVAYAQQLDGSNIWIGLGLIATALMLFVFVAASGWAVLKVSVRAIWTVVIIVPTLWAASVPGAWPRARATAWQFVLLPIMTTVFIAYVAVIGLAIERLISAPLPAELGGSNPFAHVMMMGAASLAGWWLLRYISADLTGESRGRGMIGRAGDVALGMGMHAAFGAAGGVTSKGAKGLWNRARHRGQTAWDQLDSDAEKSPQEIHGPPEKGFDPVPTGSSDSGDAGGGRDGAAESGQDTTPPTGGGDSGAGATPAISAPATSGSPVALAEPLLSAGESRSQRQRQPLGRAKRRPTLDRIEQTSPLFDTPAELRDESPNQIPAMTQPSVPELGEDIPPPLEPPPLDDDAPPDEW
ncbi:hypothetical protein [Mycolicibacterium mageritense]|uniref:hypothetical protein n=1 Tax=Mycolicibacterium mageritense TaxID=53462 RepID=UPI001E65B85B|nr:hypothetical protein [Mycolicibacterium mageritense]MCC9184373.1 hypothetical protein [Mycolicibacterium mageritense]